MNRHLILAPHHDDAEFGMGGVIQQLLAAGDEVAVIVAAYGDYRNVGGQDVKGIRREAESAAALEHLGVKTFDFLHWFKENKALSKDFGALVAEIEESIRIWRPTHVYVCLPSFNQDHQVLYDATITAFRPGKQTASLYAYEYPGNAWGDQPAPQFGRCYYPLTPEQWERKVEALGCHGSQGFGVPPYAPGVTPESAMRLALMRGFEAGVDIAEVIYVLKEIVRV